MKNYILKLITLMLTIIGIAHLEARWHGGGYYYGRPHWGGRYAHGRYWRDGRYWGTPYGDGRYRDGRYYRCFDERYWDHPRCKAWLDRHGYPATYQAPYYRGDAPDYAIRRTQDEVRHVKHKTHNLERENKDLEQENRELKQEHKQHEKRIEKLEEKI